jgi:hypothetical protein
MPTFLKTGKIGGAAFLFVFAANRAKSRRAP